ALYAVLALRLDSRAYAVLSLVALPIGLAGALAALVATEWQAVGFSVLVPGYALAAHAGRRRDPFRGVAEPFVHAAAGVAVLWVLASPTEPLSWPTAATAAVIGGGYAMYAVLSRRAWALAATAAAATLAVRSRAPAWLLLAALQFAAAWYWLAKVSLPPPAHPSADTLLVVYSPLPLAYGLLGLALRARWGRSWAWPLYAAGAAGGLLLP